MARTMQDLFDLIHRKQAEGMLDLLQRGDLTAQEMNAINKFLSDNNVTGVKGENTALNKLSAGLAAYEQSDNVVAFK